MPKRIRDHQSWLIEKLTDPKRASSYLNSAREDSQEMFFEALRDVAQARQNMSDVAKDANVTRESLYKVTSAKGNPKYDTFDAVLRALGLDFHIEPRVIRASAVPPVSRVASRRRTPSLGAKVRTKTKRITIQSHGVVANLSSAQHSGSSRSIDFLFWCADKPGKQSGTILGSHANTLDSGALSGPSPEPMLEAYVSSELLERNYGRQEGVGNAIGD
jgi:probable addiction module antidote protein